MTLSGLKDKKIAVLGLGINNQFLVEYFKRYGIGFKIFENWEKPEDLIGKIDHYDIVFRTPGLPFLSLPIQQAKKKGVSIYSQTKLFFDLCPCPIIAVTGTKGKGTTATLISKILQGAGKRAWLGGNVGNDPFEFLESVKDEDFVVLELSSFQLQDLHKSPHVAVVLKIAPEHMDYHQSFEEYVIAKKNIVLHQSERDFAILNYDNEVSRSFSDFSKAKIFWNSRIRKVNPGCFVEGEKIYWNSRGAAEEVSDISEIKLMGKFNLENITAAIAAGTVAVGDGNFEVFRKVIGEFQGLPHRLEFVRQINGVKFFNDSFSTTPETACAAIEAFDVPLILIVGGSEKKSDYTPLARSIKQAKTKALIPIGVTGPAVAKLARTAGYVGRIIDKPFSNMREIVRDANEIGEPGDIVLLSPASASFGMFENYKQRGELFKKFVNGL